jgi:hypothetical protein
MSRPIVIKWRNKMNMSDDISALAEALSKAQGAIDDASKGSINPHFKSKYADLAAVRSVIREPLAVNDLSIVQLPKTVQGGVEVTTMLLHKSGQYISESLFMPSGKPDAHGFGSAISYARRYSLMSILCLAADDDDGNGAVERPPQQFNIDPNKVKVTLPASDFAIDVLETSKLLAEAQEIAKKGSAAMRDWWSGLKADQRNLLSSDQLKKLKAAAAAVDKEAQ